MGFEAANAPHSEQNEDNSMLSWIWSSESTQAANESEQTEKQTDVEEAPLSSIYPSIYIDMAQAMKIQVRKEEVEIRKTEK